MLPHHRSNINNAFSSCVSDLQKIRFVFNHLIQYEWGDIGNASDWSMTDSLCITHTLQILQVSIGKCDILNSDPIYPSKKDQNYSIQTQENTVQIMTILIAFTTSRGQTCVLNEIFFFFFFSREHFRFVRRAPQVSKFSPASISVCKLILSPNLFRPGWDGNKASLCHSCALCSVLCAVIMWPGSQSPADEWAGGHMQLATLLEPWPTSLIWLMWHKQTATPAPARQWDTEPTSSHLRAQTQIVCKTHQL